MQRLLPPQPLHLRPPRPPPLLMARQPASPLLRRAVLALCMHCNSQAVKLRQCWCWIRPDASCSHCRRTRRPRGASAMAICCVFTTDSGYSTVVTPCTVARATLSSPQL